MSKYIIGIDQSTQGTKAMLFDDHEIADKVLQDFVCEQEAPPCAHSLSA